MDGTTERPTTSAPAEVEHGRAHRLAPLIVWAVTAAAVGYVLAFDPTDAIADPASGCLWHALFGVDGPACGGTRMMWHLLHGDVIQAARYHLAALVAVPFLGFALVAWTANRSFGARMPVWRPSKRIVAVYGVAFLLYAVVLRNLPWTPFTWFGTENIG